MGERPTPERLAEIRDAVTSGNENAGRLRLEGMAFDLLAEVDAITAERDALRERLDRLREAAREAVDARAASATLPPLSTYAEHAEAKARVHAAGDALVEALTDLPPTTWRAEVEAAVLREAADKLAEHSQASLTRAAHAIDTAPHWTSRAEAQRDAAATLRTMATTRGAK